MGTNSSTTQQQQSQTTQPWAPTIPALKNIVDQIGSLPTSVTPDQAAAIRSMISATGSIPNFGPQGANIATNLLTSNNGIPQAGIWNTAYNNLQSTLNPFTSPDYLNPLTAPGVGTALQQTNSDITNKVNSLFAGAGRSGAGSAAGGGASNASNPNFLSYSLAGAEAPIITDQFNRNVAAQQGAAGTLYGAGAGTATGTTQLGQQPLLNQIAGLQAAGQLPGLYVAPSQAQYSAATTGQNAPFQNIASAEGELVPIAGLGGQGTSQGTSTTSQPVNPFTTALGAGLGLWALSDERTKENIEPVGILYNGLNVYKYNFKGDARPQIGVMAQEVEKVKPEAVIDVPVTGAWGPSVKMVNYGLAA